MSTRRTASLGKYLVTISRHLAGQQDGPQPRNPSRERLHALYLLSDLLHHVKYHTPDNDTQRTLTMSLQPFLVQLFSFGASEAKTRVGGRLSDLAQLWKEEKYFDSGMIGQLFDALKGTTQDTKHVEELHLKAADGSRELPYMIPPTHGDPTSPYHDLPAGNLMRHIVPTKLSTHATKRITSFVSLSWPCR